MDSLADKLFSPVVTFKIPTASPRQSTASGPQSLAKAAAAYVAANEGRRNRPYKDSKGLRTVGVGHLMAPTEPDRVLSDAEVDALFAADLAAKEKAARGKLGDAAFDSLPEKAKVAVIDGFFRGDLAGSPKTLKLLKEGKLSQAADEYLNNAEYRASKASNLAGKPHGVAARMERNAEAFRSSYDNASSE